MVHYGQIWYINWFAAVVQCEKYYCITRERVGANRKADTRLQTKLCDETMIRRPSIATGCLKFITSSTVYQPRTVNPITRTDLFWLAHVTQQKRRPALNPLSAWIETPHLLTTTDAFTATDYHSFIRKERERNSSPVYETCHVLRNHFITFHNVFERTHFRDNPHCSD